MTRKPRTRGVTILALGVLITAVLFWMRFYQAVRRGIFIDSLNPGVSPAYLALTGLVFGVAALPVCWGLWTGRAWAAAAARRYAVALAVYYVLDSLLVARSASARENWPFAAVLIAAALSWVFWTLRERSRKNTGIPVEEQRDRSGPGSDPENDGDFDDER